MKIAGKDVLLYVVTNSSPEIRELIGCSRSCVLQTNTVTAPKSTVGSGTSQEFKALSTNWNVNVDGLVTVDENMDIAALRALQLSLTTIFIYFVSGTGDAANVYYGSGIITSVSETGNYNDVDNYSVQIQGTGQLAIDYGDYPPLFQIISAIPDDPQPGYTLLSFVWNAATPTPDTYRIRIMDFTSGVVSYQSDIPEIGHTVNIAVVSTHSYAFQIQSNYNGLGNSLYSPQIYWP